MTTLLITTHNFSGTGPLAYGAKVDGKRTDEWLSGWHVVLNTGTETIVYDDEVLVLPPPRHAGEYDPQHPGELEPDAYDRMSYKYDDHGRHLLHTGTE
jgi:hypothetical protein